MATIGKVSAVFSASTSGLTSGVNRASSSFRQLEQSARSSAAGIRTLVALNVASFVGNIASAVSGYVRSLVNMGAAQAQVIDRTSKLSDRLGLSYGDLAGLALAGDLAGVSMDQIATAMTKADVALVKATNGSKQANAAFASLGLNVAELAGMNAADRFEAISAAIAALPTEAQRAAAAVALFGRSGAELLPLFNSGAEALAEAREEAERLGLALTDAQGQDVEAMNDAFTLAYQAIQGIIGQVTAYLSPALKAAADTFRNLVGDIGGANIGQAIGDGLLRGARFLAQIGDYIIQNFSATFQYLSSVGEQFGQVGNFINRTASFLSGVFNAAQAGLGVIILGFGGMLERLATIARKIGQFLRFDTSTLDVVVAASRAFNDEIQAGINENLEASQQDFANAFAENVAPVGQAITGPLTAGVDAAIAAAEKSANKISKTEPKPPTLPPIEVAGITEAIKATDSRSREGVAEMFRIMRGTGKDVEQEQLEVQREIRDELRAGNEEPLVADF